jgi:ADP-heptose:LPS heptosyltransferase
MTAPGRFKVEPCDADTFVGLLAPHRARMLPRDTEHYALRWEGGGLGDVIMLSCVARWLREVCGASKITAVVAKTMYPFVERMGADFDAMCSNKPPEDDKAVVLNYDMGLAPRHWPVDNVWGRVAALFGAIGVAPWEVPAAMLTPRLAATKDDLKAGRAAAEMTRGPVGAFVLVAPWSAHTPRHSLPVAALDGLCAAAEEAGVKLVWAGSGAKGWEPSSGLDLRGKTGIEALIGLVALAKGCLVVDTGSLHLAAALGKPTVALIAARPVAARIGKYAGVIGWQNVTACPDYPCLAVAQDSPCMGECVVPNASQWAKLLEAVS